MAHPQLSIVIPAYNESARIEHALDRVLSCVAEQGWDGIEWRVTDQLPAETPGFWAGNKTTWPLTGLESHVGEIARITRASLM